MQRMMSGCNLAERLFRILLWLITIAAEPYGLLCKNFMETMMDLYIYMQSRFAVESRIAVEDKETWQRRRKLSEAHIRFRKDLARGFYQHGYTAHAQKPEQRFANVCLINTLRALGVKVPYYRNVL